MGLHAGKILCISDYQGGGKAETLVRLLETIYVNLMRVNNSLHIEIRLMETNLAYLLDWINYFL